ncbi:MAG: PAN domain-containing protein [Fimbriimonadaceae bacterium]|nr:PAN domain-containing protein [Alphaproteobacteria bacterium]
MGKLVSLFTTWVAAATFTLTVTGLPAKAQEVQGYQRIPGSFINGSGIGTTENGHTALSCAARCNAESRCLSFEMSSGWCSINMASRQTRADILWQSPKYTYYERIGSAGNSADGSNSRVSSGAGGGQFVIESVFSIDADRVRPARWARNGNIFDVQFARRYQSDNCIGNYRVRYEFDRDVRTLDVGETFRIAVSKIFGSPPCGHKWTRAVVLDAENIILPSHPEVPSGYQTNGNIDTISGSDVLLYDETAPVESVYTLKVQLKKNAPYSAFALRTGDNVMYFFYRYVEPGN